MAEGEPLVTSVPSEDKMTSGLGTLSADDKVTSDTSPAPAEDSLATSDLGPLSKVTSQLGSMSVKDKVTALIAMDGSEFSDYALQFYAECLYKPGNETVIAHTTEYKCTTSPGIAMMSANFNTSIATKEIKPVEDKASEIVEKITQRLKELGIEGDVERIHGEPGPAIITLSTHKHADYIVVGCRGKGQIRKTFTGSVTDYITRNSHVPVVVARHKDHLEKFQLRSPFKRQKSRGDPTSPTSPTSTKSPTSPGSSGSPFKLKSSSSTSSKTPSETP